MAAYQIHPYLHYPLRKPLSPERDFLLSETYSLETYNFMSERYFTHASPTLFNAGTPHLQMLSCFLVCMKDDGIEGIYDTLKNCAMISKTAGGIGLKIYCIRATGYVFFFLVLFKMVS